MLHSSIFDVYPAIPKAIRLGEIEATDEADAIEKAAKEFQQNTTMLIVVRRLDFPPPMRKGARYAKHAAYIVR
jgi:hypothetical protein